MDDIVVTPFNKDKAVLLKRMKKKEEEEVKDTTIDSIVNYVTGVYEKKITKAINSDSDTESVSIRLPFKWRKYTYNNSDELYKALRGKFNPLGFRVSLYGLNEGCFCPIDYLCNRNYGVKLYFD